MASNPIVGPSGPGSYSKRTDMGTPELKMGSIAYGEGGDTAAIKSGAPLEKTRGIADNVGGRPANPPMPQAPVTPLFAPTTRPGEPITNGVDVGAGAGSNALMMQKSAVKLSDTLAKMLPFDTTGEIAVLYQDALARGN